MLFEGVDAGSRSVKAVLLDEQHGLVASAIQDQGHDQERIIGAMRDALLRDHHVSRDDIAHTIATGYGRSRVSAAGTTITEITCQAVGIKHLIPDATTIVDIGGQDSKVIHLDAGGRVRDFMMNDRCAAGSGRFLEMAAARLDFPLDAMSDGATTAEPIPINSTCAVFAETEIVGLLATGAPTANIMAGIKKAIAERIAAMVGSAVNGPVVFTGGVALVGGMAAALEQVLERPVTVAPYPQLTGAIGAALMASRQHM